MRCSCACSTGATSRASCHGLRRGPRRGHAASPHRRGEARRLECVAVQPHGTVMVTIHALNDPAGLESKLRADGVPATVRFSNQNPRACLYYPGSPGETFKLLSEIFPDVSSAQNQGGAAFDIDILAIPMASASGSTSIRLKRRLSATASPAYPSA